MMISPYIIYFEMQPNALLLRQNFIIREMWVLQYTRERKRTHRINMVKGHLPCSPTSYCSNSCTLSSWRFSKSLAPNGSDRKEATQANK
jgi:hypothetical protein